MEQRVTAAPFERLLHTQTAAAFMRELCVYWQETYQAHGAAGWLQAQDSLRSVVQVGRGLALCDEEQLARCVAQARPLLRGELLSVPLGTLGAAQLVGARSGAQEELALTLPLLALALEGVQAREARSGHGRVTETLAQLATRIGGSLDLPEVLTATAQSAAHSLGFERALVGLFEAQEGGAGRAESSNVATIYRTAAVYMHGFAPNFAGTVDVGPESFARLMQRGEVITYHHKRDAHTALGRGLSEFAPQVALIAPLKARGQPLGILYADSRQPPRQLLAERATANAPDSEKKSGQNISGLDALLLALAEHASLAIDNARLYAEETRKRQVSEALREAGAELSRSLNLGDVAQHTLSAAQALFGADACAVHELQPGGRSLSIRSAFGLSSEFVLGSRSKVGQGVTGQAVAQRQRVTAHDLQHSSQLAGGSRYTRKLLAEGRYPFRGVLSVPLSARGRVFGGLTLYYCAPLPLSREECALAEVFAAQAALALENARLYEEQVAHEQESALLLGVAALLRESARPQTGNAQARNAQARNEALREVTRLLTQALGATRGLLALRQGESWQTFSHQLATPAPEELQRLQTQLGRGPRPLSRRALLPATELHTSQPQSGLVAPLRLGEQVLGYYYADHSSPERPGEKWLGLCRAALGQITDVLGREALLLALEREEARYRLLAHSAHDLIMVLDSGLHVTYANPASLRLLGPLAGQALVPLLLGDSVLAFDLACQAARQSPEVGGRGELRLRGAGRELLLEVRISALAVEGQPNANQPNANQPNANQPNTSQPNAQGLLLVARDLSELQTLADEINRRAQELADVAQRSGQLRDFLALFTQAQEEERRRISRELHDDTAQVLVAIGRRLGTLGRQLTQQGQQQQAATAADIRQDLNSAIESVRRFARNLRPSVLDDLGLLSALEWLTEQTATPTRLEVQGHERRLENAHELTIFRTVQEALGNVDKHAQAQSAAVRVVYGADKITVSILDDGRGLDPQAALERARQGHLGLVGMRERVGLAGGTLQVLSEARQGSEVRFILPL